MTQIFTLPESQGLESDYAIENKQAQVDPALLSSSHVIKSLLSLCNVLRPTLSILAVATCDMSSCQHIN